MTKKGIRVRYIELMTLLSICKVSVHMNQRRLEKCEIEVLLLDFYLEIQV